MNLTREIGTPTLHRHFGLLHAVALNVTMVVGAGVFITIPPMLTKLPGPYALLGWLAAGGLILVDGLIWSELATLFPGSGGTYRYLLEGFGKEKAGRLFAFLFIWQFLLSGPLELASGLIAVAQFSLSLSKDWFEFNETWSHKYVLWESQNVAIVLDPSRWACLFLGFLLIFLLYRKVSSLGKMTVVLWVGVLLALAWIIVEGILHFDPAIAWDWPSPPPKYDFDFFKGLGGCMILAMYSYLGYYNICYMGDEVRDPGSTLPRAVLISAGLVMGLFVAVHLSMMGTVKWIAVKEAQEAVDDPASFKDKQPQPDTELATNLAGKFMDQVHKGTTAKKVVTVLLIWTCLGSAFAGLLGYSRIPYGAARYGHFFSVFEKVHPFHHIPHVSLLFVGAMTLFWSFFDLQNVINALVTTRILEQFIAQVVAVVVLRISQPNLHRPFRIWFYPIPCALALGGWLFIYTMADLVWIMMGLTTLAAGIVAYFVWSNWRSLPESGMAKGQPPNPL